MSLRGWRLTKIRGLTLVLVSSLLVGIIFVGYSTPPQLPTLGALRIVVIQVGFADARPQLAKTSLEDLVFNQLNLYVQENSQGRAWIEGAILATSPALPSSITNYAVTDPTSPLAEFQRLASDAIQAADLEADFHGYDRILLVFAGNVSAAWVPGLSVRTSEGKVWHQAMIVGERYMSLAILAHELGHDLGLPDLYAGEKVHSSSTVSAGLGPWCIMSDTSVVIDLCAWCRIKLGWINSSEILDLRLGDDVITSLRVPTASTGHFHAVRIMLTDSRYFLVEARAKTGFDAAIPQEGILVSLVDESAPVENRIVLEDAHPSTASLRDAAFDIGTGSLPVFLSAKFGVAVVVLERQGLNYNLHITTPDASQAAIRAWQQLKETELDFRLHRDQASLEGMDIARTLLVSAFQQYAQANYSQALAMANEARAALDRAVWPQGQKETALLLETLGRQLEIAVRLGFLDSQAKALLGEALLEYEKARASWEAAQYAAAGESIRHAKDLFLKAFLIELTSDPSREELIEHTFGL